MADIAKALDVLAREGAPRKATWVHGLPAVREMYLDQWTRHTPDTLRATLTCDDDLGDLLATTAPGKERYGIVLRGAETLSEAVAPMLTRWVTSRALGTHVLFVADQEAWPRAQGPAKTLPYRDPALREVFAHPRTSTLLVEGTLADTKIGHAKCADVIAHCSSATPAEATVLAALCDHDLTRAIEVAKKADALGTYVERALRVLSAHESPQTYTESLLACQAATAAAVAHDVPAGAYPGVLARLDYALDLLARIHRCVKDGDSTHALASRLGVNRALVDRYRTYAKHYTSANVVRRTDALLWASEQVARGRRDGVLELVAVQW